MPFAHRFAGGAVCLALLAGCAGNAYVDGRREAGTTRPVGPSSIHRPAICHGMGDDARAQALVMANDICAKTGRVAVLVHEQTFRCALFAPNRSYYQCVTPDGETGDASPVE